jgi:hypothetical protein
MTTMSSTAKIIGRLISDLKLVLPTEVARSCDKRRLFVMTQTFLVFNGRSVPPRLP